MKQQYPLPIATAAILPAFVYTSPLQAADFGYHETYPEQIEHLTPSNFGNGADITLRSIHPLTIYSISRVPWDLLLENKNELTVGASLGYTGNVRWEFENALSSSFLQAHAGYTGYWKSGNTSLAYEIAATGTRYDEEIPRQGHNNSMYDFGGSLRLRQDISQSTIFYNHTYAHYGAHLALSDQVIWPGVQNMKVFNWRSTSQLAWRTDGQPEFSTGLQQRTSLYWGGFNEVSGEFADSFRVNLGHTTEIITNPGHGWFFTGEYGVRDFKEMTDYTSDNIRFGVGRFGKLPCGANYRVGAGIHHQEYDHPEYDNRTEPYFSGTLYGTLAKVDYRLYLNYGIHHDFANWGGGNFVDPRGTKAGVSLSFKATDKIKIGANLTGQHLQADSSRMAQGSLSNYAAGMTVRYDYSPNLDFTVDAGVNRVSFSNNGPGNSEIFGTIVLGARLKF